MMELDYSEKNEITFIVARSNNEKCTLFYRDPSTEERITYSAEMIKKINGTLVDNSIQNRLNFGKKILTGFAENQFTLKGKPISSDPANENYDEHWKELVIKLYADLIIKLAYQVFEGTLIGSEMPAAIDLQEETEIPLESSSLPQ